MSKGCMFKNKNGDSNNISGSNIARIRKSMSPTVSQRALADSLQLYGIDVDKNAVQRIESGKRFVTDIELVAIAKVLQVSVMDLLREAILLKEENATESDYVAEWEEHWSVETPLNRKDEIFFATISKQ